jgi:DNA-directed RNA polymerase subunit L
MKTQASALDQHLILKAAKIPQLLILTTERVGKIVNYCIRHNQNDSAKMKFKAVRDLENKQYLNQSCVESLSIEEKLRIGYYNF